MPRLLVAKIQKICDFSYPASFISKNFCNHAHFAPVVALVSCVASGLFRQLGDEGCGSIAGVAVDGGEGREGIVGVGEHLCCHK